MTKLKEVYKCSVCGNIVEVLHAGEGTLVCCGEPMELLKENSTDAAIEKHVPVLEKTKTGILVKIGSVPHPMTPEHYIEWVELIADGASYIKHLKPSDKPEAEYCICNAKKVSARIYCNLHGLWKSKN